MEERIKTLEAQIAALEANNEQVKADLETKTQSQLKTLKENTILRKEIEQGKVETNQAKTFDKEKFLNDFFKVS